jgi:hypothetical protein
MEVIFLRHTIVVGKVTMLLKFDIARIFIELMQSGNGKVHISIKLERSFLLIIEREAVLMLVELL